MRNAEASKERILEAAMAEFSAYGIAGARMDRMAEAAGCNKNLIYIYFESKEALFATVLQKNLVRVYDDLPFTPEDLPGFAVRVFDYAMTHPDLMRLIAWFGLEHKVDSPAERSTSWSERLSALKKAQNAGTVGAEFPTSFLLTAVMSLATAYTAANPFGPSLNLDSAKRPANLRKHIADAVRLLASPEALEE